MERGVKNQQDGSRQACPDLPETANQRLVGIISAGLGGGILLLGLSLFIPFFEPIAWAIVLALFFYPFYNWLERFLRRGRVIASVLMCVLIVAFIVLPVFTLLGSLTSEVFRVYGQVQESIQHGDFSVVPDKEKYPLLNKAVVGAMNAMKTHEEGIKGSIADISKKTGEFFIRQGTVVFANIANIIFKAALMVVTLYYLFRDGERMLQRFTELLPLSTREIDNFARITSEVLYATLYGNLMTAFIQAGLGILILWSLDFSAPLLWGIVMGLSAFIPIVGTALVWVPATLYLFMAGYYLKGAILLAFSIIVISQVDYFLRPILISGKTQLHSLFLFFSILGGIKVLGIIGLVLGPLIVALCVAVLELYKIHFLGRMPETGI